MSADNMSRRESRHESRMEARETQDAINAAEDARRCESCGKPSNDVCEYVQGEFVCRSCAPGMALFLVSEAMELLGQTHSYLTTCNLIAHVTTLNDIGSQITAAYAILRWMHPDAAKAHEAEVARAVANNEAERRADAGGDE